MFFLIFLVSLFFSFFSPFSPLFYFLLLLALLLFPVADNAVVEGAKGAQILELWITDVLEDNVNIRLQLQHLERQAQKGRGLHVAAVHAAKACQLHSLVNHSLR